MPVRVRYKGQTRNYLASPYTYGRIGYELWWWSPRERDAHEFPTRAAAKAVLKELRRGYDYKLSDFTFEKV